MTEAFREKEVAYYAALLAIEAGYSYWNISLEPLMRKDTGVWKNQHEVWLSEWTEGIRPKSLEEARQQYARWLIIRLVSDETWRKFRKFRVSAFCLTRYRELAASREQGRTLRGYEEKLAVGDAIVRYAKEGKADLLEKLPADTGTFCCWSTLLVNDQGKDLDMVLKAFLRFAEAKEHAPEWVDLALSALVVRGYDYDAEKGRYKLNGVGKLLLEYAIAHPIPRSVSVARVLKERWDKVAVMQLIQKHHPEATTWEKFEQLAHAIRHR